jgi:heme exporter protein A
MLDIIALDFDYQDTPLLSQVHCHLPAGGLLHIQGSNGKGKTTLLKLLAGFYTPLAGELRFLGHNIHKDKAYYQSQLCYLGHQPGIHSQLSLSENCRYDSHYNPKKHNIAELAALFGLQNLLDLACGQLSAGQQRLVALLRLWMTQAPLWLLDEPLVALDEKAQAILMNHMQQHRQRGGGIVLTSHQALPLPKEDYQVYVL